MKILYTIFVLFLMGQSPQTAEVTGSSNRNDPRPDVRPARDLELTKQKVEEREEKIQGLIDAIRALEFKGMRLNSKRRRTIAEAAYKVGKAQNLDPRFLIALARMESDFTAKPQYALRCHLMRKRGCQADCGITQHAIWGSKRKVFRMCKRLTKDHVYSMTHSAKEINRHIKWCKARKHSWYKPLMRCVMNRYNSGHTYYILPKCKKRLRLCKRQCPKYGWWKNAIDDEDRAYRKKRYFTCIKQCKNSIKTCYGRAMYWRKLLCFYYGAKTGKKMKRSCRYCTDVAKIPWYYKESSSYSLPLSLSY